MTIDHAVIQYFKIVGEDILGKESKLGMKTMLSTEELVGPTNCSYSEQLSYFPGKESLGIVKLC